MPEHRRHLAGHLPSPGHRGRALLSAAPGQVVVSHFRAKPGRAQEVLEIMAWHVAATHEEPGVLVFALHQAEGDPDQFVMIESYADAGDLWKHKETPHYEKSMAMLPDLIEGNPQTTLLGAVPLGDPAKSFVRLGRD